MKVRARERREQPASMGKREMRAIKEVAEVEQQPGVMEVVAVVRRLSEHRELEVDGRVG